jgi:hypothetical protein
VAGCILGGLDRGRIYRMSLEVTVIYRVFTSGEVIPGVTTVRDVFFFLTFCRGQGDEKDVDRLIYKFTEITYNIMGKL